MSKLNDGINRAREMVRSVMESQRVHDDSALPDRLSAIEKYITFAETLSKQRESARSFLLQLKNTPPTGTPDIFRIDQTDYQFSHLRFIALAGYLAVTWGVYDNLSLAGQFALEIEGNSKFRKDLVNLITNDLLNLNPSVKRSLRKDFEVPGAISYQIRNMFLHGNWVLDSATLFTSQDSIAPFHFSSAFTQFISDLCKRQHDVRDVAERGREYLEPPSRCFVDMLVMLEEKTDELAAVFAMECINSIMPARATIARPHP